jgi:hypothetical protein
VDDSALDQLHEAKARFEKAASDANSQIYMFVFIVIGLIVLLMGLWQKMQSYERRHFL